MTKNTLRVYATGILATLIIACLAWETVLAPLRPEGSWLVLKCVPLLAALPGVYRGKSYTYQWALLLLSFV
jgi:uncharacterized membrane protein